MAQDGAIIYQLHKQKHHNHKLQEDFNNYGVSDFVFYALEVCNVKNTRELRNREAYWINKLKEQYELYNCEAAIPLIKEKSNIELFTEYINSNWLIPNHCVINSVVISKYAIYNDNTKKEILKKAKEFHVTNLVGNKCTYNTVMVYLKNVLGYTIIDSKKNFDKKQHRYKLITKCNYEIIKQEIIKSELPKTLNNI